MKMKNKMMRIICISWLLAGFLSVSAQNDLQVGAAFERFEREKGCKMVVLNNTVLRGYKLQVYKALTYKYIGNRIKPYLQADRKKAKKIREIVENGKVSSGYYMLPPLSTGINRYILFTDGGYGRGALIYIEGALGPDDVLKLCYSRR